jgi:hypothetical protein
MISLKIGSLLVDTSDIDIPVVLRSPVFANDEGKIPGSFVFNFSLPLTDDLKRELEFAHRASRKGKPTWQHPSSMSFGPLKYAGTATITKISLDEVEFSMPVEVGNLANDFGELELKDLEISEVLPWDPELMYADLSESFDVNHGQQLPFTQDIQIPFSFNPIDNFTSFDLDELTFTAPATRDYRIVFQINSFLHYILNTPQLGLAGKDRKVLITKNGSDFIVVDITADSFSFDDLVSLTANDELKFYLRVSGQYSNFNNYLHITIQPGTSLTISNDVTPFDDIPGKTYPDANFAVFPYQNPEATGNMPDSLFQIDINDIKDNLSRFAPVINYYRDGHFPYVVSGAVNDLYYSMLNLFSPAPYLAFIIKKIFAHVGYTIANNVFEGDELKRITVLTANFLNNYFPGSGTIYLKDFIPEASLKDFFRDVCRFLGIVFKVNTANRSIEFKFIDDIMADMTSIEFNENISGTPEIDPEEYQGFALKITPTDCDYIKNNYRSLDDVIIKGFVSSYALLPEEGNQLFDCFYVNQWHAWYIWNYDPDKGAYAWVFHSIDYSVEVKETVQGQDPFTIDLKLSSPAMQIWDPENPAKDPTVGSARYWHIPALHLSGNFKNLPSAYRSKSQYALIPYWGLQKDASNQDYPFASNDVYNYGGTKIDHANIALRPDGDCGLYEKKWKRFIQWRLESPGVFKIMKHFTALELSQLNWFRWHKIHGVDYLLKEVRFNIKNDRLSIAQILAHKR